VRQVLLAPHLSYLEPLLGLLGGPGLHALAHITGGGLTDNVPRSLPAGTGARIDLGAWEVPPLFRVIAEAGEVSREEMLRVFNMGIGMVLVVAPEAAEDTLAHLARVGRPGMRLGEVLAGGSVVEFVE
jgi:phosphoribosylformylglycinamidine cyclo-ligase